MRFATAIIVILMLAACACADVPTIISYQGKLMQPSGAPVPDGTYSMVFAIYDDPILGTPGAAPHSRWTETNPSVQTKGGLYSVLLGSINPIGPDVFSAPDRFFAVKVGSDAEMTPRQKIASVGFAMKAATADNGVPIGGIMMWSGAVADIPQGWKLCDGTNGTPDLRNRFTVGAGDEYAVAATGGEKFHQLTVAEMPSHNHGVNDPGHSHQCTDWNLWRPPAGGPFGAGSTFDWDMSAKNTTTSTTGISIQNTGGDAITHETVAHENRPPYYALCFIMKVGS